MNAAVLTVRATEPAAPSGRSAQLGAGPIRQPIFTPGLSHLLGQLEPVSLAEMEGVALLDRTDTKYVMSSAQLYSALAALTGDYRVLDVGGTRLNRYRTLYFDTDDFMLYHQHHSGKPNRCKVRSREYLDSRLCFLEVKWKGKRDRTTKIRIHTDDFATEWAPATGALLQGRIPPELPPLQPKVLSYFRRATLVSKQYRERVTLDVDLQFAAEGRTVALPGIAIAEVKQDGVNRDSYFVRQLRSAGLRPGGFSKYCMAVALLYPDLKHNRFKPQLRLIDQLAGGDYHA